MNILVIDELMMMGDDLMGHFMHLDLLHLLLGPDCGIIVESLGCCPSRHWLVLLSGLLSSDWCLLPPKRFLQPDRSAFLLHFWAISNSEGWAS